MPTKPSATNDSRPNVYLTFDDGPVPITSAIVDALNKAGLNATFFLNMNKMESKPDEQYRILRKLLDGGHFLGNHGYDHDPMSSKGYKKEYEVLNTNSVKMDFEKNLTSIKRLFELKKDKSFIDFKVARLPGDGRFFQVEGKRVFVDMITQQLKIPHVSWEFEFFPNGMFPSRQPRLNNWMGLKGVSAEATSHTLPKDGAIILLHDHHWDGNGGSSGSIEELAGLFKLLGDKTRVVPLIPVPTGHPSIRYP